MILTASCRTDSDPIIDNPTITGPADTMVMWYDKPGTNWMIHALPIGNGTLGGMFFGGVPREEMQFNEKSLWSGSTQIKGTYRNFGSVFLNFDHGLSYTHYRRELSLDNAMGTVAYTSDGVAYLREYFVSFPDEVMVMRLSTPNNTGSLNLSIELEPGNPSDYIIVEGNSIGFKGSFELLSYETRLEVLHDGGTIAPEGETLKVSSANTVTILLKGATNFSVTSPTYTGETAAQLTQRITQTLTAAAARPFSELRSRHINDYQELYNRVNFNLGAAVPDIPLDRVIADDKTNLYLDMLFFQYGRYLMIASSRGMELPNNLQGIWNHTNNPPWQADIHTNINIQMNYWPAESANLSELHLPLLKWLYHEATRPGGGFQREAADEGNPGWTVRTELNIFGHHGWHLNRPANAWLCMHLWQHYAYTLDETYLRNTAFPVMKAASEYWLNRLIWKTSRGYGEWVAPYEWSPEHGDWEDGPSYAQQLIWDLFDKTLKAAKILNINDSTIAAIQERIVNLDNGLTIGQWNQIREWRYTQDDPLNKHRHLSHLMALYPGDQISPHLDVRFSNAARVSMNARDDGSQGSWSNAAKMIKWARLLDGDRAYNMINGAKKLTTRTDVNSGNFDFNEGGVYENMFTAHPFQIEGNFGLSASIAEMLVQSHVGLVHLMPALPAAWPNGTVTGLKAQGNFTVDISWANSQLISATIRSGSGGELHVYHNGVKRTFQTTPGGTYTVR